MALNPTTLLEAVNTLLYLIGEMPVNSLDNTQYTPASFAETNILDVARAVQTEGLHFNTDYDLELKPDTNKEIKLPNTAVRVDPVDRTKDYTVRAGKLYNKEDHTYKFDESVKCHVVWLFNFEEMPEHVRQYVTIRAGRIFQNRLVGSEVLYKLTQSEELEARTRMRLTEAENEDENMLEGPLISQGTLRRGSVW